MRKFNLKGTVVERMKGIQRQNPVNHETKKENKPETPEISAEFSELQGTFLVAWRTDVGKLRKNNQDAIILGNGLAGVADGMGGHLGGEIASSGLRDGLLREIKGCEPGADILSQAVRKVNRELWEKQEEDASLTGMGTTLTILWPAKDRMIIGQIGDSRAYLLRDGKMVQVTSDHSMVADMVRKGVLTEEQAACHPMRNYITRAVGTEEDVEIDITFHDRVKGDRWLICSDGLYGMVPKDSLSALASSDDPEETAQRLLQAALDGGGRDNISLVILQDETDIPEPEKNEGTSPDSLKENTAVISGQPEDSPESETKEEDAAPETDHSTEVAPQ